MAEYVSACGFVQFDPREREANNQKVIDYTIKTTGTDGVLIRVTVWPELQDEDIEKGDFVAVDGKLTVGSYTGSDGASRQSVQISATSLAVLKGIKRAEREVVNTPKGRAKKSGQNTDAPIF